MDSEKRLAFSSQRMFDERITVLSEILDLIKRYPNFESNDPTQLFNKEYLNPPVSHQSPTLLFFFKSFIDVFNIVLIVFIKEYSS